uniref:Uncharacterized protein n=1 Tax=Magallana gigas TaxID=29159 RepID=A0A8W8MVT9_MAGGI
MNYRVQTNEHSEVKFNRCCPVKTRIRSYRKVLVSLLNLSQFDMNNRKRLVKERVHKNNRNGQGQSDIILRAWIGYLKSLKERNVQLLQVERTQMKWEKEFQKMDCKLENLEQRLDVYTSRRAAEKDKNSEE